MTKCTGSFMLFYLPFLWSIGEKNSEFYLISKIWSTSLLRYLSRNFNYWSKLGINGPRPLPGFGNILDFFIIPRPKQEINWLRKYGKIYG